MEIVAAVAATVALLAFTFYLTVLVGRQLFAARTTQALAQEEHRLLAERIGLLAARRRREQERADRTWDGFRKFVVARKVEEAKDTRSFYLEPHDRRPLPSFAPGQYLTFRLPIPGQPKPVVRCYSLSDAAREKQFRVTIKRIAPPPNKPGAPPGLVSSYFHDELEEGDIVDVKAPAGHFILDPEDTKPVVLVGGGIGVTPVLAMLNSIVEAQARRDVWFFYGVRNQTEHAMAEHLQRIASENSNVHVHVCYSDPGPTDRAGQDYRHAGRVGVDLFKRVLPADTAPDFFICGPSAMMESLVQGLTEAGVPEERIHFEAFGPASVKRLATATPGHLAPPTAQSVEITFARSEKTVPWDGRSTLLEVAEATGVKIDFGCRAGNCGTCLTALKSGEVYYPNPPGTAVEVGSCLTCVALPQASVRLDA